MKSDFGKKPTITPGIAFCKGCGKVLPDDWVGNLCQTCIEHKHKPSRKNRGEK